MVEAAVQVIAREGADGATTRKIADEPQAPLTSLHYCFQNKENLLLAVFIRLAEEMPVTVDLLDGNEGLGRAAEQALTRSMQWDRHPA
ncbi:helix-turn-helix domain-containing protein [Streptomyces noursei]|uniref:helix-turn-helix domain-containing protein n=1 Tax=Streptomyces noursei TaxID=1971 RepID=UPI0016761EF5|nr:helix-turn-helix domain-containing protein [Streptomyces noursei]MCZ1014183.1 helix-turn-helix domain containing protein [Streptomyces noursei]